MSASVHTDTHTITGTGVDNLSDEVLVAAAKTGDAAAFVELNRRHATKLLPRAYRITKNWQDAEDVVQESFLRAFVHLSRFEGRCTFSSWLTRIAINCALMMLRKRRGVEIPIEIQGRDGDLSRNWEFLSIEETPEKIYAEWQREELLRAAIDQLRPSLREVIKLRQAEDYSTREIAELLGISVAAAKSRLLRARSALRISSGSPAQQDIVTS